MPEAILPTQQYDVIRRVIARVIYPPALIALNT